jgi:hypothetical protein
MEGTISAFASMDWGESCKTGDSRSSVQKERSKQQQAVHILARNKITEPNEMRANKFVSQVCSCIV